MWVKRFKKDRERALKRDCRGLLEGLESRCLLTVDLTGAFTIVPVAALSGTKQTVAVSVSNGGTTKATGTLAVDFYAALDGVAFDVNTAKFLIRATRTASIPGLGGSQNVNLSLPLSAALAAGDYRLYAVIDPSHTIAETDDNNNTAQSGVVGIVQPNYDLVPTFGASASLVPAVVAGVKTNATVPVVITNPSISTVNLPAGLTVAVQVVARPVGVLNESQDVVLNTHAVNVAVGGLQPGKTRTVSVAIQFPTSLAIGNYNIVAKVDTGAALAEVNETNNGVTFTHAVGVANPFSDPALTFHSGVTVPANVVADGRPLPLKFDVTNLGNVTIPGGTTASLTIVAHNLGTSANTVLQVLTVQLGGLGSGKVKTFSVSPSIPLNLANGNYEIDATLSTTVSGNVVGNDSASSAGTMSVGAAFFNVAATPPVSLLPSAVISGTTVPGFVTVGITNLSNTFLLAGTRANILLALRPAGALNNAGDIPIGNGNVGIGNLAIGATQQFHLGVTVPATKQNGDPIALGDYVIVSTVTPVSLAETTAADNTAVGDPLKIAAQFADLAITSASNTFPVPAAAGSHAMGTVGLRNMGNVTVQGNVTIQFLATPTDNINDAIFIGSSTFFVNLAPGQTSQPLNTALTLSTPGNGFLSSLYTVYARIDPASFSDADGGNSQRQAGTVIVSAQQVDLKISSATTPFTGLVNGGSTGTAQIVIGNFGSGTASGQVTITYYASTSPILNGSEIAIGTQVVTVALGPAQLTTVISVPLTLPNPGVLTAYNIIAKITADPTVDNNPNDNTSAVLAQINVMHV